MLLLLLLITLRFIWTQWCTSRTIILIDDVYPVYRSGISVRESHSTEGRNTSCPRAIEGRPISHEETSWQDSLGGTLKLGEEFVLSTKYLRTCAEHLLVKLRCRWVGPFRINKIVSSLGYGVDLLANWHIHPIFHISRLKKLHRSAQFVQEVSPPHLDLVEGHLEYMVDSIAQHHVERAKSRYLVIWKVYPLHEASWDPEQNLAIAPEVLAEYPIRF